VNEKSAAQAYLRGVFLCLRLAGSLTTNIASGDRASDSRSFIAQKRLNRFAFAFCIDP
jgi:hypothetical protein